MVPGALHLKMKSYFILAMALAVYGAHGQGTLVADQQSGPNLGNGLDIQTYSTIGQSFTLGLNSIGYVTLALADENSGNGLGAALYVNLLSGSINGTIF